MAEPESASEQESGSVSESGSGSGSEPEPEPAASASTRKTPRRIGLVLGLGLGIAVLAASTAFGVIAGRSPAPPVDVAAANGSAKAPTIGAASGSSATQPQPSQPSTSASTVTSTFTSSGAPTGVAQSTAPWSTPSPSSSVTGSVADGVHQGDLRYFLAPPPQGPSSVQGDANGTTETLDEVVQDFYGGTSAVAGYLQQGGFKAACALTYQDSKIGANVTIELIQFGSPSAAAGWMKGFSDSSPAAKRIPVPGEAAAAGWSLSSEGGYSLLGVYEQGDTFFQVQIYGSRPIPPTDLGTLVGTEFSRLANG